MNTGTAVPRLVPQMALHTFERGGWRRCLGPTVITNRGIAVGTFYPIGSSIADGPSAALIAQSTLLRVASELAEVRLTVAKATGADQPTLRRLEEAVRYWRKTVTEALDAGMPAPLGMGLYALMNDSEVWKR